jgi:hypothetical protein
MPTFTFPRRTIHLDFHTGRWIPELASEFDPERFARTFKDAHVDSVTLFATCHHGNAYWNTKRPERHPGLPAGLDLLGEQIKALHKVGIRAPIYLSVQCNEFCADTYSEWRAINPDGSFVKAGGPFNAAWQIMDMSSPYQDYVAEQLAEVLERFAPVDGIFMDMCWDQPSVSRWAIAGMKLQGLNPELEADRWRYAHYVAHQYMERYAAMVERAVHGRDSLGVWFNSRPRSGQREETKYLRHIEVECLPTGGWGYSYFPYVGRMVRKLGLPTLSHTGRFFKSWGDNASLKPAAALKYECLQTLAQGMSGGIGDLLHPRGVPSPAVYELIGGAYGYIERCEPFVHGGELQTEIAVLSSPEFGEQPGDANMGAVRMLQQLQHQFDIIFAEDGFKPYALLIVPESIRPDAALRKKLSAYLKAGGKLVVEAAAALDENGAPILKELGIVAHGESPFTATFLRAGKRVAAGLADYDYVMYDRGLRLTAAKGAEALARIVEPYGERTWDCFSGHDYTAPEKLSKYAGAVATSNTLTFAVPIFGAYARHAAPNYRTLFGNCLAQLLPRPLVRCAGPSLLETSVVRKGKSTVVHLLCYSKERRTPTLDIVEDALPMLNMPLAVRLERAPQNCMLQPAGEALAFTYRDGYAQTVVTVPDGHAMVVFE